MANRIEVENAIGRVLMRHPRSAGTGVSERCYCGAVMLDHNDHQAEMITDELDQLGIIDG